MFVYQKELQYPVKIARPDPRMAAVIISQYGGPDGEMAASLRYLSQRYSMPDKELKGLLTDIGVEELGHLEIVGAMVHQLTRCLSDDDLTRCGFDAYFVDHTAGVYPQAASGHPFTTAHIAVKGDPITDLHENLAADAAIMQEQQAPKTGLKNGRNTNVGTSFLTHCSQMKEPPSARAVRRLFYVLQVKSAEVGGLLIKASNSVSEGDQRQGRNSAGNAAESLQVPFRTQICDFTSATARGAEVLSKIICAGVAFAIIGKTVIGKSNDGKSDDGKPDVGKSKGNKY